MDVALSAAQWVVGKALAPIADGVLEAWAASKNLGANVEALKKELLFAKDTLENASSKNLHGRTALKDLLQKMRDSAQKAENALDELDYFRIHDELNGTFDAADENPKGCSHDLVQNARHTAKAFGKLFSCATAGNPREEDAIQRVPCCPQLRAKQRAPGGSSSAPSTNQQAGEEVRRRTSKLGNLFPCSSLQNVHDDNDSSAKPILSNNDEEKHSLQFSRVKISTSMKQIVDDLQPLRKDVSAILLGCSPSVAPGLARNRPIMTHEIIEPKLYGRDVTVNSIINDITTKGKYHAKDLTVLPIVGAGGIGKTTMTQHIYHNKEVQTHFDVVIWVCVSLSFDPVKLLEEIKGKIPKVEGEKDGTTGEIIAQRLKSKSFLLIMDDMWEFSNKDDWKRLLLPFTKSQKSGNIIMVTTRLPKLAKMIKTTDHWIELGGLEPIEFRKLFLAFVFDDDQYKDHIHLLEIGDKIIKNLKGSPLAAKTVGRLLREHLDSPHWRDVLESKEWETETDDHDIMPALKLSYDYLPFHLQQCFSCCALYPEDYMFTSNELGSEALYMGTLELLSNLTSLTRLEVSGDDLRSEGLWHLLTVGQLSELHMRRSPNFFVDWFPHQDEQEQLRLSRSSKLHKFTTWEVEGFLGRAPVCRVLSFSLTILSFWFCQDVEGFTKEQAEALQLLTSLQELEFWGCKQLRSLPQGLNKLTSLKRLRIYDCPSIACLPKDGLPDSLQILDVRGCGNDELKEQCRQLTGTIPEIETEY